MDMDDSFKLYPKCQRNCAKMAQYIYAYLLMCSPSPCLAVEFKTTILKQFKDLPFKMSAWVEAYTIVSRWLNTHLVDRQNEHESTVWMQPIKVFWNDTRTGDSYTELERQSSLHHATRLLPEAQLLSTSTVKPQTLTKISSTATVSSFDSWLARVEHEVKFNGCVKVHEMLKDAHRDWITRKVPLRLDRTFHHDTLCTQYSCILAAAADCGKRRSPWSLYGHTWNYGHADVHAF